MGSKTLLVEQQQPQRSYAIVAWYGAGALCTNAYGYWKWVWDTGNVGRCGVLTVLFGRCHDSV
jgi:hypothetical protein